MANKTFYDLSVSESLCQSLEKMGIKEPTPVQAETIPALRNGKDTIVQAQTGTGKTLAFLLPIYDRIKVQADNIQTLILTPTRELTLQIAKPMEFVLWLFMAVRILSAKSRSWGESLM